MRFGWSEKKGFYADILSPAAWRAIAFITCFAIGGIVLLSLAGRYPNLETNAHGGVRITTRPPEAPESEIVVRDVPSDRVKIKPQQEVADAPSRDTLQGPKPKPQTRPIDPGYYIAIIKVSAFREIRIRRKCIEPFEFPEVCKLPHRQRESRPVYFNSVPFPDQQTVDQQLPLQ